MPRAQGNAHFVAGEYQKSIVSFAAASIIHPTDPTYWYVIVRILLRARLIWPRRTNAAAARIKIGSPLQCVFPPGLASRRAALMRPEQVLGSDIGLHVCTVLRPHKRQGAVPPRHVARDARPLERCDCGFV